MAKCGYKSFAKMYKFFPMEMYNRKKSTSGLSTYFIRIFKYHLKQVFFRQIMRKLFFGSLEHEMKWKNKYITILVHPYFTLPLWQIKPKYLLVRF